MVVLASNGGTWACGGDSELTASLVYVLSYNSVRAVQGPLSPQNPHCQTVCFKPAPGAAAAAPRNALQVKFLGLWSDLPNEKLA